ncbi:HK97 family phage prohead protease [Ornithinimicrobium sp. W1665]|uniref:HK97 family phage prohead protease n=1 Tax=Ornithinimicrobium sp. W1665 TaxID=3416666 RepID=UPI003D6A44BA
MVDRLSIGFVPVEHREEVHDDGSMTLTRTKIRVREVSVVPIPAYDKATVTSVREAQPTPHQEETMSDTLTRADLDEVRTSIEDLDRELKLVGSQVATRTDEEPALQFRSFGEYVKAVAAGDETAMRAYTGATTADSISRDSWVGDVIRLGEARQRVTSLFQHTKDLPPEGMNVEYGYLADDTTQVDVQAAEGDDLLYGKVDLGTATAAVKTLGGWTQMTRQEIERSSVNVVDFSFRAMALRYAKAVETLTRGTLTAAYNDATATALAEIEADLTTQDGVVEGLIDLVEHFEDSDVTLSGLIVAKDVFLSLLAVPSTDRILQVTQAPTDKLGTLTVSSLTGNIAGVPVTLWPGAPTGATVAYDETAIRTQEAPGAPMRLQDENIVNLSKAFSVYGYAASYVQVRPGLVKVTAPVV